MILLALKIKSIKSLFLIACAPGWTSFGYTSHCYRHFTSPKSWDQARRYCQLTVPFGKKGDLASVGGHWTNTFLSSITHKNVWIGGYMNQAQQYDLLFLLKQCS